MSPHELVTLNTATSYAKAKDEVGDAADVKTPTDNELNLAMCEWIGGTKCDEENGLSPCGKFTVRPNYLSDDSPRRLLNEAEARLTQEQYDQFLIGLNVNGGYRTVISASARQRVIAVLQTVKPELFKI